MRQGRMVWGAGLVLLLMCGGTSHAQAVHGARRGAGDAEAGQGQFQRRCVMCHSLSPNVKIVGPSLYSEMRGAHSKTAAQVRTVIVNGKGQMPALGKQMTDGEIADVLAYLRTQ